MIKAICWSGALAFAVAAAIGKEFPLQYKTIKASEAMAFPGGYGATGSIRSQKPKEIVKESKAVSKHPVYGRLMGEDGEGASYLFRLDEAKGTGKGYDQLILDLNQNRDLTDDPVFKRHTSFFSLSRKTSNGEEARFGPIEAPAAKAIGNYRGPYYAGVSIYESELRNLREGSDLYLGRLTLKPGWYLEAQVELPGVKQKVGVYDGNGDMRLGDPWKPMTYTSSGEEQWYFRPGDSFLVDTDNSGEFENTPLNNEFCAFGDILYIGAKPCKVSLAADYKNIQVEPWPQALAELSVKPQGDQVRTVTLAWEQSPKQWRLIKANVVDSKTLVPPGDYRLYGCLIAPQASVTEQVLAHGYQRKLTQPVRFEAGGSNTLLCGPPLQIEVSAAKDASAQYIESTNAMGARILLSVTRTNDYLRVNGVVKGAGGEIYSTYGKGKGYKSDPPNPSFMILDAQAKQVGSGNLEFG